MQSASSTRWYLPAAALALAGTALKIVQWYFSRPLWLDEQMVLLNIRDRALSDLTGSLWLDQTAPLGWLVVQHAVVTAFGTSDRAVRALPVLFGIATLWVGFWMAQRWMKPSAAAVFVVLCGIGQWITFYALEAKPYSADGFASLALPALAIWAAEPTRERPLSLYRTAVWWSAAAIAQWFSFGATFVTPGCALVLCVIAWRRAGRRSAVTVGVQGLIWLVCFAAHYALSIRHGSNDEFLRNYWSWGFPPAGAGVTGTLRWLAMQAAPLAWHPGGTSLWIGLWLTAAYGVAVSLRKTPAIGLVLLSVPVTASLLAALRQVPLADRLALWITPAVYAAIAFTVDDVFERGRAATARRNWTAVAVAVAFAVSASLVCIDIVERGRRNVFIRGDNHGLDDRRGLRFLMTQRQPGDVLLTTHFGLPAVWWYGGIDIAGPKGGSRFPHDGAPIFELRHVGFGAEGCRLRRPLTELEEALAGSSRAAVYLGFESKTPAGFQERVLDELSGHGALIAFRRIADEGVAAIFDLRLPAEPTTENAAWPPGSPFKQVLRPPGCVGVRLAERW